MRGEGIGPIPIQAPTPSILTTARSRTSDDFGVRVPVPAEVDVPDGALDPSKVSWRTGVSWVQVACAQSSVMPGCPSADDTTLDVMTPDAYGLVSSSPFWVYTPVQCEWTTTPEEVQAASEALTEARSAFALGQALWLGEGIDGDLDQPTLRNSAQVAPGGDVATSMDEAIALLLAAYERGTQGLGGQTIHIPGPMLVAGLGGIPGGGKIANQEGNFYRGALGSVISPGPGYPFGASTAGVNGFGPLIDDSPLTYEGSDADEVWIYITGPVEYAMSNVIPLVPTSGIRRQNRTMAWSVRQLIYRFDPCATWAALAQSPVPLVELS